jgi:hypothetical protein
MCYYALPFDDRPHRKEGEKIDKISWKTISAYDLHIYILKKAWTV